MADPRDDQQQDRDWLAAIARDGGLRIERTDLAQQDFNRTIAEGGAGRLYNGQTAHAQGYREGLQEGRREAAVEDYDRTEQYENALRRGYANGYNAASDTIKHLKAALRIVNCMVQGSEPYGDISTYIHEVTGG